MSDSAPATIPLVLTTDDVRRAGAQLVTDELVIVPVRHHSPACAISVEQAFALFSPSQVLIEGPRSFTSLVDLLAHPEAEYPLAAYAFARKQVKKGEPQEMRTGAYYPFCDYSPELVALRCGRAAGVPVSFCDLELAEQWVLDRGEHERLEQRSLLDERDFAHSAALDRLAGQLGCRDHEDLWELLFEADPSPTPFAEHVARMAAYCLLARGDRSPSDLERDGTDQREAEMAWHVREAVAQRQPGDGPVLVVVGGFHAVALPQLLAAPPPRPRIDVGPAETGIALIRYGFDRLERLNGYASGMTSPEWHQRIWEKRRDGLTVTQARSTAALTTLLDVAAEMRERHSTPVSTPSLSATHQHLLLLADLRKRHAPLRSDLLDAVVSCLIQGDADTEGALVQRVTRHVLTGARVGRVPPGTGSPPIVEDTLRRLQEQRLKVDDEHEGRTIALDLYRNPSHRRTSRLLRGLELLQVPFAVWEAGPDFVNGAGLTRVQERWTYRWGPAAEGSLVELSMLGSTLPEAVAARFGQLIAGLTEGGRRPDSGEASGLLAQAAVLGLHQQAQDAVALLSDALAHESSFAAAVTTTTRMALLTEGREPLEAQQLTQLPALLAAGYARALYLGRTLAGAEGSADDVATALARLRELLAGAAHDLDPEPFWSLVHQLRRDHPAPLVRGAAVGLSFAAGRLEAEVIARDAAGHLSGSISPEDAVGFLRGLLSVAREALWQDIGLVPVLDERLSSWDQPTFLRYLPDLRLAFASLTPRETDRVAGLVAGQLGLAGASGLGPLLQRHIGEQEVQRNLVLSAQVIEMMHRDGLGGWVTPS
jgi:Family of unknown function (DUF5682)